MDLFAKRKYQKNVLLMAGINMSKNINRIIIKMKKITEITKKKKNNSEKIILE